MQRSVLILLLVLISCQEDNILGGNLNQEQWDIDTEFVQQGCYAGRDCIPSIDNPHYAITTDPAHTYLQESDLVVGMYNGSEYVAYPHPILDWHEVVNESGYMISYCPLTGSALHAVTEGEFGVSGMLYNSNLIMYDRGTESYWPQLLLASAAGTKRGRTLELKPLLETTWATWRKLYPDSKVLTTETGYSRNYGSYPYGNYKTCNSASCGDYIYFSLIHFDDRLPAKERVLTIATETEQWAFPIRNYVMPTLVEKEISGVSYRIVISAADNLAIAFQTTRDLLIDQWDTIAGTIRLKERNSELFWDALGVSRNGGENLIAADAFIAYWFAAAAFYPDIRLNP